MFLLFVSFCIFVLFVFGPCIQNLWAQLDTEGGSRTSRERFVKEKGVPSLQVATRPIVIKNTSIRQADSMDAWAGRVVPAKE